MQIREKLAFYLESSDSAIGIAINWVITILVIVSSGIFVVETYPISPELKLILDSLNRIIVIIFSIEYFLRLWAASDKIKYITNIYSSIDLLVILTFFVGIFDVTYIRIFRWFRILRLLRFVENEIFFGVSNSEDSLIISRILFTLFTVIFVYSGLIYQVEHPVNPDEFQTFLDAVYFAIVTMTTVGFGDVTPLSQGGRLLTVLMILTGIALIPGQLGTLIKELVKNADRVESRCGVCGWSRHDVDARFCKMCGSQLITSPADESDKLSSL